MSRLLGIRTMKRTALVRFGFSSLLVQNAKAGSAVAIGSNGRLVLFLWMASMKSQRGTRLKFAFSMAE